MAADKRLYLRLGDRVVHKHYEQWGEGVVVEEMTSRLDGGTCLIRVRFRDGQQRTFNNDMDNEQCCYYFGLRKFWDADESPGRAQNRRRRLR